MFNIYRRCKNFFSSVFPGIYSWLEKNKLIIKYIISGGTAASVDLVFLYIFTDVFKIWYIISAGLSFLLAYFVSFSLQKFWTFRDDGREKIYQQMSLYFIVGVTNLFLNTAGMYLLVDGFGVMYLLAQIIIGATLGVSNFLIYKFIIFEKKKNVAAKILNKKILIISGMFLPIFGGPASLLANLIPVLMKEGYQITVLTYGDVKDEFPYKVVRISQKGNKFLRIFNLVKTAVLLAFKNNQIYALDTYWPGLAALIAAKVSGRRLIARFTGDSAWETAQNSGLTGDDIAVFQKKYLGPKIALMKRCRTALLKSCQIIITDCHFLGRLLESFGVKKDRIRVVHNSVEYLPRPSDFNKENFKKENGLKEKVILSVCRLVPWKGVDKVMEVLPDLKKEFPEISLIVIGSGPEYEKLKERGEELKKKYGLDVRLLGGLERSELAPWYLSADAYVLNTNYEGIAHTLVEALYFGTPVATTDAGGNPEIIIDGYNGLVFEYNNLDEIRGGLKKLLSDKELVKKLKSNTQKKLAEDFLWEKVVETNLKALAGD